MRQSSLSASLFVSFCLPRFLSFSPFSWGGRGGGGRTTVFPVSDRLRWERLCRRYQSRAVASVHSLSISSLILSLCLSLLDSFLHIGFGTVAAVMWVAMTSRPPRFLVSLSVVPSLFLSLSSLSLCLSLSLSALNLLLSFPLFSLKAGRDDVTPGFGAQLRR